MRLILEGWEDVEPVVARLSAPDREQVQAAERLTLQLADGRGGVTIQQRPGTGAGTALGVGAAAWDSALVLAAYLATLPPGSLAGKRCIELGAGVGLAGLLAARLGAAVVLTDRRPLLSLLRGNAARNWLAGAPDPRALPGSSGGSSQPPGRAEVAALDWGAADRSDTTARLAQPASDYILAADCCYVDPGGPTPDPAQFVATAAELAAPHTQLLMAHEVRPHGDVWPALEAACRSAFNILEELPLDELPQGFRVPHIKLYRLKL